MTQNIIIADDHIMIRKGMKLLLMSKLGCKAVAEAGSCSSLLNELKKSAYSHLVLDVVLSDGSALEIIPVVRKLYPSLSIMIYSMQPEHVYGEAFRQYGVNYYLSKASDEEQTVAYAKQFLNNEPVTVSKKTSDSPFSTLAPRELEVLHYLLNGYKTKEIAETLNLSNSTISTFKNRIFEKTGASSLANLYELASINDLGFYLNNGAQQ